MSAESPVLNNTKKTFDIATIKALIPNNKDNEYDKPQQLGGKCGGTEDTYIKYFKYKSKYMKLKQQGGFNSYIIDFNKL